ncbi:MAG: hypothetical protein ACKOC4_12585, partial [Planctomycetia bacterium]
PPPRRPRPASGTPVGRKGGRQAGQALPLPGSATTAAPDRGSSTAQGVSVARHVQDAFGPELKHIASSLPGASPAGAESQRPGAATRAEELASALRNPATLRQLVLLREILERPVDRW